MNLEWPLETPVSNSTEKLQPPTTPLPPDNTKIYTFSRYSSLQWLSSFKDGGLQLKQIALSHVRAASSIRRGQRLRHRAEEDRQKYQRVLSESSRIVCGKLCCPDWHMTSRNSAEFSTKIQRLVLSVYRQYRHPWQVGTLQNSLLRFRDWF